MTALKRIGVLGAALLVSACQTPPPKDWPDIVIVPAGGEAALSPVQRYEARRASLLRWRHWQLDAKLAVKGNERPTTAQLAWSQRGERSSLDLSGPVGIGRVSLQIEPGVSTLRRGNGKTVRARSPEELIERVIGWPMPASLLRWWIVGLADQGQLLSIDPQGRPEQFQYAEWTVSYGEYIELDGVALPRSLSITDGHLQLHLSRARWRLQRESAPASSRRLRIPGVDD